MALKPSLLLLFACLFFIATKVTSYVDSEEEKLALQRKAPIPAPVKAPIPAPVKAPAPAPNKAPSPPHCAPSPMAPPTTRTHLGYCVPKCQERCKANSRRIRPCVRVCTKCCEQNNRCVPSSYENCPNWDTVIYHGEPRKCP